MLAEILEPESVTMISIGGHEGSSIGGFTAYYRDESYWQSVKSMKNRVLCLLGGKCATEVKYGTLDAGCSSNIERAVDVVKKIIIEYAGNGFDNCSPRYDFDLSEMKKYNQEKAIKDELEKCYTQARQILIENRDTLDKLASELNKKKLLISEDIKKIIKN